MNIHQKPPPDKVEMDRLYNLWTSAIMARVRAPKREGMSGPIGVDYLNSRDFSKVCALLGLDETWARKQLLPYADYEVRLPKHNKLKRNK